MGTSGLTKGPGGDKPLVPSWLDDDSPEPLPGGDAAGTEEGPSGDPTDGDADGQPDAPPAVAPSPLPPIPPVPAAGAFPERPEKFQCLRGIRRERRACLAACGQRLCAVGVWRLTEREAADGEPRAAFASGALGVFRGFQRDGVAVTLRRLNLGRLVGGSPADIFLGLTDVICPDGSAIDESMARDAWLETVVDVETLGIVDSANLSETEVREIFLAFVSPQHRGPPFSRYWRKRSQGRTGPEGY